MFKKSSLLLVGLCLAVPLSVSAQDPEPAEPIYAWSSGHLDPVDLTAYYSVFVASGDEALGNLVLTANVPEGATFVDGFWMPETATLVGEADGVVTWELSALEAGSIAGPFTFRATFEDAEAEDFAPPGAAEAAVLWEGETIAAEAYGAETLVVPETEGTITIDAAGTVELVPFGETGVWIYVPENAVSEPVTLSISSLPVAEGADLPAAAEETWWCGQYAITADKDVTFAAPITIALPTRRALTPSEDVAVFASWAAGEWSVLSLGDPEAAEAAAETVHASVGRDGLAVGVVFDAASFGTTPTNIAIGVPTLSRTVSVTSIKLNTPSMSDPAPWF